MKSSSICAVVMSYSLLKKRLSYKKIYVEFKLENDLEFAYVYHINKKGKYYLESIKLYPLPVKELETPEDGVELIRIDDALYSRKTFYDFTQ
jgi:hypothetical protein